MNVLCVDQDRTKLRQMKRDAKEIVPDARIAACRDPSTAERLAREKGCDVLLTNTVFDGLNWDGVMLAERIQRLPPRQHHLHCRPCGHNRGIRCMADRSQRVSP